MDLAQLRELRERVESATGPDRTLDGHLYGALGFQIIQRFGGYEWRPEGRGTWRTMPSPTESLDAALALVERVLPGWRVHLSIGAGPNTADLCIRNAYPERAPITGATPALALLSALLNAMEAARG